MFKPIRTVRPFEDALRQIMNAIRSGDLRIGDKLPSERLLAKELDISRPTLRESLRILTQAGVLSAGHNGRPGAYVATDVIPNELDADVEPVSYGRVSELLEFRRMFEPRVVELAHFRATEEDLTALEETLAQLRAARGSRARFMLLDERFQLRIARSTHNDVVISVFSHLFRDMRIVRDLALREDSVAAMDWATESLARLLGALMSGDLEAIEYEVSEHLGYLEAIWRKRTGRVITKDVPSFLLPRVFADPSRGDEQRRTSVSRDRFT